MSQTTRASHTAMADDREPSGENHFLLRWRGDKAPLGASIGGVEIAKVHMGTILDARGGKLGAYERVLESEDGERSSQALLVRTEADHIAPPAGGDAFMIRAAEATTATA